MCAEEMQNHIFICFSECCRLMLPIGFKLSLAYIRVWACFHILFSLLTIFNIVIGNTGNSDKNMLAGNSFYCCRCCCQCRGWATTGNKKCCRWNADRQQVECFSVALFLHTHNMDLCMNLCGFSMGSHDV